eukprot:TRINITY_DN6403_c0_g1_i1.p1 TRINITY_DN6403_c0_g1~~TRINITY_DN6403_c0_g1_i1.p1  ORF type:complete len:857 (-),score=199.21 TRINITY_DN6403_c0_g1_i1:38-2494(-)
MAQQQQQGNKRTFLLVVELRQRKGKHGGKDERNASSDDDGYNRTLKHRSGMEVLENRVSREITEKADQHFTNNMFFFGYKEKVLKKRQHLMEEIDRFISTDIYQKPAIPPELMLPDVFYSMQPDRAEDFVGNLDGKYSPLVMPKERPGVAAVTSPRPAATAVYTPSFHFLPNYAEGYSPAMDKTFAEAYGKGLLNSEIPPRLVGKSLRTVAGKRGGGTTSPLKKKQGSGGSAGAGVCVGAGAGVGAGTEVEAEAEAEVECVKRECVLPSADWVDDEVHLLRDLYYIFGPNWAKLSTVFFSGRKDAQAIELCAKKNKQLFDARYKSTSSCCVLCGKPVEGEASDGSPSATCRYCCKPFHLHCSTCSSVKAALTSQPPVLLFCTTECQSVYQTTCEVCKAGSDDAKMLLCDNCSKGYHIYCLNPPLTAIPEGTWLCRECLKGQDAETLLIDPISRYEQEMRSQDVLEEVDMDLEDDADDAMSLGSPGSDVADAVFHFDESELPPPPEVISPLPGLISPPPGPVSPPLVPQPPSECETVAVPPAESPIGAETPSSPSQQQKSQRPATPPADREIRDFGRFCCAEVRSPRMEEDGSGVTEKAVAPTTGGKPTLAASLASTVNIHRLLEVTKIYDAQPVQLSFHATIPNAMNWSIFDSVIPATCDLSLGVLSSRAEVVLDATLLVFDRLAASFERRLASPDDDPFRCLMCAGRIGPVNHHTYYYVAGDTVICPTCYWKLSTDPEKSRLAVSVGLHEVTVDSVFLMQHNAEKLGGKSAQETQPLTYVMHSIHSARDSVQEATAVSFTRWVQRLVTSNRSLQQSQ